jgi:uncharacterized protein (TIGR00290 family)
MSENPTKSYFNWSTGKDSALALFKCLNNPDINVSKMVTVVNKHYDRVSMHGLSREMMELQLSALNIPYSTIELPKEPTIEEYSSIMEKSVLALKKKGFTNAIFGDIFLEDLRSYRENQLNKIGISSYFPLWKKTTSELIKEFMDLGFKAIVVCINNNILDKSFVGRELNQSFINDLPENVDPCGENGEFHTFCYDGPIFKKPILFTKGNLVHKKYSDPNDKSKLLGFWFCELNANNR